MISINRQVKDFGAFAGSEPANSCSRLSTRRAFCASASSRLYSPWVSGTALLLRVKQLAAKRIQPPAVKEQSRAAARAFSAQRAYA